MAESKAKVPTKPADNGKPAETASGNKTKCPLTRDEFIEGAKDITVIVNGETKLASKKVFSTGGFGYFFNDKVTVMVGDTPVKCQANVVITAIGSKPEKA